jgi:hypothetical protein
MKRKLIAIPVLSVFLLFTTSISAQTVTIGQLGALPGPVDLTAEGNLDWAFCGLVDDANQLIRMDGDPLIVITPLHDNPNPDGDTGVENVWSDDTPFGNPFSWTNGTPVATGTDEENSWWMAGVGNGFEITAPVSPSERVLTGYHGIWYAKIRVIISIDGEIFHDFTVEGRDLEAEDGNVDKYWVAYSGSAGSVLKVEWLILENLDEAWGGWGNGPLRAVTLSGVESLGTDDSDIVPSLYSLSQNYPNPFNPTTTFDFSLEAAGPVNMAVYDLAGHKVRTLVDASMSPGTHSVTWDGRNDAGIQLSAGVYFYRMTAGTTTLTKKMMLMK